MSFAYWAQAREGDIKGGGWACQLNAQMYNLQWQEGDLWFLHMSLEFPSGVWSTFTLKYAQESTVFHCASSALHLTSKYVSVNVSMVLCTRSRAIVEAEWWYQTIEKIDAHLLNFRGFQTAGCVAYTFVLLFEGQFFTTVWGKPELKSCTSYTYKSVDQFKPIYMYTWSLICSTGTPRKLWKNASI